MSPPAPSVSYEPVTLTIQVQDGEVWITSVCAPVVVWAVTDRPVAPVSLMAGVPVGDPPAGTTNTWNDGPAAGAGAHAKAQPMFHGAAVVVNDVLVQLPLSWGDVSSTRAGPAAAAGAEVAVVDDPPATVVVVAPAAAVVVVVAALLALPPAAAAVVVVVPPPPAVVSPELCVGGGRVPFVVPPVAEAPPPPPVSPLIHMPMMAATTATDKSCQVFQERRCLILSSPG